MKFIFHVCVAIILTILINHPTQIASSTFKEKIKSNLQSLGSYKMFLIRGINFAPEQTIGKMTLIKKHFSCSLYETWEVKVFEKDHMRPFTALIFKYSLSSTFPLTYKHVDAFCLNILKYNKIMTERNLDVRVNPCYENKSQRFLTNDNSYLTYILFSKPDGGYKLASACNSQCARDRICRYSIKNVARGILRLLKISQDTNNIYDLAFLMLKDAFYYGRIPSGQKVNIELGEKSGIITNLQTEISNFQKIQKTDDKNYFIIIPFLKFFRPEEIETLKSVSKEEKAGTEKIMMTQVGLFLANIYDGLDEAEELKVFQPGDNFSANQEITNWDYVDLFFKFNKEEIAAADVHIDKYFGVKEAFAKTFAKTKGTDMKFLKNMAKGNNALLKGSFYEFLLKLINYYGDQFKSYEEALNHRFLNGQVFLTHVESDTGEFV